MGKVYRSLDRWKKYCHVESKFEDFMALESMEEEKLYSLVINDKYLDLLIRSNPGAPIVFLFHGAVPRPEGFNPPVFSGLNVVNDRFSRVLISDPCLLESESLALGWFGGSTNVPLQEIFPEVINKIISLARPSKVIFAGGSGGGFASLYYSSMFEGSVAVASNPQINILKYYKDHVERYARHAWGCGYDNLSQKIDVDLNLVYKSRANKVFYIQNSADAFHLDNHCSGFIDGVGGDKTRLTEDQLIGRDFYYKSAYWGEGHVGPSPIYWKSIIDYIGGCSQDAESLFDGHAFHEKLSEAYSLHVEGLFEKAKRLVSNNDYLKAKELFCMHLDSSQKPEPKAFSSAFDVFTKLGEKQNLLKYYKFSQALYPNGWSVQYHYASSVFKLGDVEEAELVLKNIIDRLGDKTPVSVIGLAEKIQADKQKPKGLCGESLLNEFRGVVSSEIKRSERRIEKSFKREFRQTYSQLESLQWLMNQLNLKGRLPQLRGWSMSPDVLLEIHSHVLEKKPNLVVELGSGVSTLVIADALKQNGQGKLISVDHLSKYAEVTSDLLQKESLLQWVEIRVGELEVWNGDHLMTGENNEVPKWYPLSLFSDIDEIEVLIVDGPPEGTCSYARYPALPALREKLVSTAQIWIDDTNRAFDSEICSRWADDFKMNLRSYSFDKGLVVLS